MYLRDKGNISYILFARNYHPWKMLRYFQIEFPLGNYQESVVVFFNIFFLFLPLFIPISHIFLTLFSFSIAIFATLLKNIIGL